MEFQASQELERIRQLATAEGVKIEEGSTYVGKGTVAQGFEDTQGTFGYIMSYRRVGLVPEFSKVETHWYTGGGERTTIHKGVLKG